MHVLQHDCVRCHIHELTVNAHVHVSVSEGFELGGI